MVGTLQAVEQATYAGIAMATEAAGQLDTLSTSSGVTSAIAETVAAARPRASGAGG
jgi:hypothetical protein